MVSTSNPQYDAEGERCAGFVSIFGVDTLNWSR